MYPHIVNTARVYINSMLHVYILIITGFYTLPCNTEIYICSALGDVSTNNNYSWGLFKLPCCMCMYNNRVQSVYYPQ